MGKRSVALLAVVLVFGCGRRKFDSTADGGTADATTAVADASPGAVDCESVSANAYFERDGHCYTFHAGPSTYFAASETCMALGGGRLASLTSQAEHDEVLAGLGVTEPTIIGATEAVYSETGEYAWPTTTAFGFSLWDTDEPMAPSPSMVVVDDGLWQAVEWTTPLAFICEFEPWYVVDDTLEVAHFPVFTTHTQAQAQCERLGGILAVPGNDGITGVLPALPFDGWVDASDTDGDLDFAWADGESIPGSLLSDEAELGERCLVLLPSGLLEPSQCEDADYFPLCQRSR